MSSCCGPDRDPKSVPLDAEPAGAPQNSSTPDGALVELLAADAPSDLKLIGLPGGSFRMGSEAPESYPGDGEGPVRTVSVAPFALAATAVTVAEFAAFVLSTGYRTEAEVHGDSLVFAGRLAPELRSISPAVDATPWWVQVDDACWHRPEGPGSTAAGRSDHPVTHVSWTDAEAYAKWVGGRLPTETEWEYAARGGLDQQPYPWGTDFAPEGQRRMNTFTGEFPDAPTEPVGTMPAGSFPSNDYGLHNMTGNVWEWTASRFAPEGTEKTLRGGSYMCHASYCRRYRTSARIGATTETSLGHTGFRIALGATGV